MQRKYKIFIFLSCFILLAGILILGLMDNDKYASETDQTKQREYDYQWEMADVLIGVNELQDGVNQIQLISTLPKEKNQTKQIMFDINQDPKMKIDGIDFKDRTLFVKYGIVENPNAVKLKIRKNSSIKSQEIPVINQFYFIVLEDFEGSYFVELYDKNNQELESFGFVVGAIGRKDEEGQYTQDDAIRAFKASQKLNNRNLDNYQIIDWVLTKDSKLPGLKAVISFYDKEKNNSCNLAFIDEDGIVQEICFAVNEKEGVKDFEIADGSSLDYIGNGTVATSIRKIETNEIFDYKITISYDKSASATNFKVVSAKHE